MLNHTLFQAKKKQPDDGLHSFHFNIEPQPFGGLTAHEMNHLSLLPSGPDEVRKISLRETKTLRLDLKTKIHVDFEIKIMAESERFELSVRYQRTHDFQSCSLSHSDNSPARSENLLPIFAEVNKKNSQAIFQITRESFLTDKFVGRKCNVEISNDFR